MAPLHYIHTPHLISNPTHWVWIQITRGSNTSEGLRWWKHTHSLALVPERTDFAAGKAAIHPGSTSQSLLPLPFPSHTTPDPGPMSLRAHDGGSNALFFLPQLTYFLLSIYYHYLHTFSNSPADTPPQSDYSVNRPEAFHFLVILLGLSATSSAGSVVSR